MDYKPRVVDDELIRLLAATGAVIVEGPRACGKTSTARQVATSEVLLDTDEAARTAAAVDPRLILKGATPRLIDEWQIEPQVWNHVRREIDSRRKNGQFVLTGSSVPADDVTRHTGAGRISRLRMRPMSLYESGHSTGEVSLRELLEGGAPRCNDPGLSVTQILDRIVAGGWPGLIGLDVADAANAMRAYLNEVARSDVSRVEETRRDPVKVGHLLRSLARNVATTATASTLVADMTGAGRPSENTVYEYVDILERLMIVENQPGWKPDLRSKSRVRSSPKRHFVDPSLAAAAVRATPHRLVTDLNYAGFLFESLVVRDLRVFAQACDARVYHYRDNTGLEVDAVVERDDGTWAAFEVKLGHAQIEAAADNLLTFRERVASDDGVAIAVIVSTGFGYQRDDGVAVIPVGALGP